MSELEEVACRVEAEQLLRYRTGSSGDRESDEATGPRMIAKVFDGRSADSLKHLALALIAHPNIVALLGSRDSATARLVFARSPDASGDMNALMRKACEMLSGRGGGKPDMAQGGGKDVERLSEAIEVAKHQWMKPE